MEHFGFNFM